jgi:hypothetical protein
MFTREYSSFTYNGEFFKDAMTQFEAMRGSMQNGR